MPTGDLGMFGAAGCLHITGRKKDIIVVGGVNVSPMHVEHILGAHESVERIAVLGMPDRMLGERVVAFVVLRPRARSFKS